MKHTNKLNHCKVISFFAFCLLISCSSVSVKEKKEFFGSYDPYLPTFYQNNTNFSNTQDKRLVRKVLLPFFNKINPYLGAADFYYKRKDYEKAISIYEKILNEMSKISTVAFNNHRYSERLIKLKERIVHNLSINYILLFKRKIASVDREYKSIKIKTVFQLERFWNSYQKILEEYGRIRILSLKRQLNIFNPKSDKIYTSLHERLNVIGIKIIEKKEKEKKALISSAKSHINNKISALCQLAELHNSRYILETKYRFNLGNIYVKEAKKKAKFHKKKAIESVLEARKLLKDINSTFIDEKTIALYNRTVEKVNKRLKGDNHYSAFNILAIPFRYVMNIGKGISDIFVLKFGYGVGVGAEVGPLGTGLGFAKMDKEVSTAYAPFGKKSAISQNFNSETNIVKSIALASKSICSSNFFIRSCPKKENYSNLNVWFGFGPSVMINIESHRLIELGGVLLGQNWNVIKNGKTNRFEYFPYKKVSKFKLKKKKMIQHKYPKYKRKQKKYQLKKNRQGPVLGWQKVVY